MKKITLYKVVCYHGTMPRETGEGWSLDPWSGDTDYYQGETLDSEEFILPDGYELLESGYDNKRIYRNNEECEICTGRNGMPYLAPYDFKMGPAYLKRVEA